MTLPMSAAPGGVAALAGRLRGLAGWRRALAAAILGVLATGALPPVQLVPLVFVAFSGLVLLLEAVDDGPRPLRGAFLAGWWFGFGHFVTNLYWLAHALLIDAAQFGWMVPFAVFGLSGFFAVFTGAACLATAATRTRGAARVLVLAIAWTIVEWLRGHILTGFPWNLIGTVWTGTLPVMQVASLVGLYGLGLLTVLVAALPAALAAPAGQRRWGGPIAAALLLVAAAVFGMLRLPNDRDAAPDYRLRLVQPNVPQSLKWDPAQREANLAKTLALSRSAGFESRTHVIWPETAVPFVITDFNNVGPALREGLASAVPPGGLLLTGAPRAERDAEGRLVLWNSLHALDPAGAIVATYDKFHLVPFGEYVPLRSILKIAKVTVGNVDFSPGPGLRTLALPGLPDVSPLICYEAIFPAQVVAPGTRPAWLLNITNDAWFGISSGPYQHFTAARFRAVEEGLPLVRAANNGISAVVDSYGRIEARLELGATGVVDAALPPALPSTLYSRFGDGVLAVLVLAFGAAALRLHNRRCVVT